jgi:hypothetical protein
MSNPLVIIIVIILSLIVILSIFRPAIPYLTFGLGFNTYIGDLKGSFQLEAFDNSNSLKSYYVIFPDNFDKNKPLYKLLDNVPVSISNILTEVDEESDVDFVSQIDMPFLTYSKNSKPIIFAPNKGYKTKLYIDEKYILTDKNNPQKSANCKVNTTDNIQLLKLFGADTLPIANITFKEITQSS